MAITQEWDNADRTIMRQVFTGWWNVKEYQHTYEIFATIAQREPHTVHYILDFSQSDGFLGNLPGIVHDLADITPANAGICVAVAPTYQTETMFNIAHKVAPSVFGNLHYANTLHDARQVIWRQCQTFEVFHAEDYEDFTARSR
ncbi:MAG: hypothetical protein AAFV33_07510 [Chloroflexota bacterium]